MARTKQPFSSFLSGRDYKQPFVSFVHFLSKLYHVSFHAAALIALVPLTFCVWYAWSAYSSYGRYNRALEVSQPLSIELFHLYLYDELRQDIRRLFLEEPPAQSKIPVFSFKLTREDLSKLQADVAGPDKRREPVPAYLTMKTKRAIGGGKTYEVSLRYRGSAHWHWNYQQKSMKVYLPEGDLIDQDRVFNLMNEVTPLTIGEEIILDLARETGLLTPDYYPVRVEVNNNEMGVYFYESQPEESFLRKYRRMPGSIYSGDKSPVDPKTGLASLWQSSKNWNKVASLNPSRAKDMSEIVRLTDVLNQSSQAGFNDFASHELDQTAFARFEAIDVIFGGDQHDYSENHKLYFDPYKGRFEPIAWNFRGWRHEPRFNIVDNPLGIRLKMTPDYLMMRNRAIYELLAGTSTATAIRERGLRILEHLLPELLSDRYWDAYKLLPRVSPYYRQMVRPMDESRLLLVFESEMQTMSDRVGYLMSKLTADDLSLSLTSTLSGPLVLDIDVSGEAGYHIESVRLQDGPTCLAAPWKLVADADLNGEYTAGDVIVLDQKLAGDKNNLFMMLSPGIELVARKDVRPELGFVETRTFPQHYRYFLVTNCDPDAVEVRLNNVVSGGSIVRTAQVIDSRTNHHFGTFDIAQAETDRMNSVPRLLPGERSAHPWIFPSPFLSPAKTKNVTLGPAEVLVKSTLEYGPDQSLTILPGTTLKFGPGISLIVRGRLIARGTPTQPIQFVPEIDSKPWGGLALQGQGTRGSRLAYVRFERGTKPSWRMVEMPGMVDIHDTNDIRLEEVEIRQNIDSEEALHVAYSESVILDHCRFLKTAGDAIDFEIVKGELRSVIVVNPGDEGLDLQEATVLVQDSIFLNSPDNGISAGQNTSADIRDTLLAGNKVGVLVKDAASVNLEGSLLFDNETGVQLRHKGTRYRGTSELHADTLHAVQCRQILKSEKSAKAFVGAIIDHFPDDGEFDHLMREVIGIPRWDALSSRLAVIGATRP